MCKLLEQMCLPGIRKRISLRSDWKQETEESFLFTYLMDEKVRFLEVPKSEDGAEFFKEEGIIDEYEGRGKFLKMYNVKSFLVDGKRGQEIKWVRTSVIEWKHIKIFESDVIHFAAKHEYKLTSSLLGLCLAPKPKAIVRNINHIQAA